MSSRDHQGATPVDGRDPTDTPLLAVLSQLEADGFDQQFNSRPNGMIHCFSCGQDTPAQDCAHGPVRRLEGASDPADMLAVIPVKCPHCGVQGTIVANYGPETTVEDAEVLVALDRHTASGEAGG
jgi:hypothetical protein